MADDWTEEPDTAVERSRTLARTLQPLNGDDTYTLGRLMGSVAALKTDVATLGSEVRQLSRDVKAQTDESREHAIVTARRTARQIGGMLVVAAVVYSELRPVIAGLFHHVW